MRTQQLIYLCLASMVILSSCFSTRKAPPLPEEPDYVEVIEIEDTMTFETFVFDVTDTIDPIFLLAKIERQECYGDCPEYSAAFYSNGYIIFKGSENVDKIGSYEAMIDTPTIDKIRLMADRIGYFSLAEFYPTYGEVIDDLPTTVTFVSFIFKENMVSNVHGSPARLHKFERYLEEILSIQDWKPIQEGKR